MKTFGRSLLAAIGGYGLGFLGGMLAIETFSTNTHDRSMEAAMTGAFVAGPLVAVVAVIVTLALRSRPRPDGPS